jgi:hypothetical protein
MINLFQLNNQIFKKIPDKTYGPLLTQAFLKNLQSISNKALLVKFFILKLIVT